MTDAGEPTYRLELPIGEVAGLFLLLEKPAPPFIAGASDGGAAAQGAALRSLLERGVIRLEGTRAQMAEGAAGFVDVISQSPVAVRVHRARRETEMAVWYSPTSERTVRTEITPEGDCRWLNMPSEKLGLALAVDCGLAGDRAAVAGLDFEVTVDEYGALLAALERGVGEGMTALTAAGLDDAVAGRLAGSLGGAVIAFDVSMARVVGEEGSSLEISSAAWLDAGPVGPVRVVGPDLAAVRAGLAGDEPVRLHSVSDRQLLDELSGLLADSQQG